MATQNLYTEPMFEVKTNNHTYQVSVENKVPQIDGQSHTWDLQPLPDGSYSLILNGKSYVAYVQKVDKTNKLLQIDIDGTPYELTIKEPIDQLLEKMGIAMGATKKAEALKAPMPGLVLKVLVEEGQSIQKGEPVLVLEAMKMENVFKATSDAMVKKIKVSERQAVEKGEVLIELA